MSDNTDPPPPAAAAPAGDTLPGFIKQYLAALQPPTPVQPDTTPVKRGWLSLLGEGLGGGTQIPMSPADKERAGLSALMHFGTGLMAASRYSPGQTAFSNLAGGFEGAQRGLLGAEQMSAARLGAQQDYQLGQRKMTLEGLKDALPLLQMQQGMNLPNPLDRSNTGTGSQPPPGGGGGEAPGAIAPPSGPGVALGMRQNNPLNLAFAGQSGATPAKDNRFATFQDVPTGIAATADELARYQTLHGVNTVQDAVTRWVGDPKANLTSYIGDVSKALGVKPTDKIDLTDPAIQQKFILAAQPHESGGGGAVLNPADVGKGVQLAARSRGQIVQTTPVPPAPVKVAGLDGAGGVPGGSPAAPAAPDATPPASPAATPPAPGALTLEQYRALHLRPLTPADYTMPVDQESLDQAQRELNAASQNYRTATSNRDTAGANAATQASNVASDKIAALKQDAAKATIANRIAMQKAQDEQLSTDYNAEQARIQQAQLKTQELTQTADEAQRERQAKLDQINATAGATERTNALNGLNTEAAASAHRLDDLTVLRGLSTNLGDPTFLTTAHIGGQSLADILSASGIGSDALKTKAGQAQAFRAATLSMVRDLRMGGAATGEPRSNQDLSFITSMVPSEMQSPATRNAIISYIEMVNQRRMEYASEVGRMAITPEYRDNVGGAMLAARKVMPDMLKTVPNEIATGGGDIGNQRLAWFRQNVTPGTFYRAPNGRMQVWSGVPGDPDYIAP